MRCLMSAWQENQQALKNWLLKKTQDHQQTQDILQDVFIKALQHKERFCTLSHAKSWLFTIAKNCMIDSYRKVQVQASAICCEPDDDAQRAPVADLQQCLIRVLAELDPDDQEVIERCDMQGMSQRAYAQMKGLSISASKSKIQRARKKLREQMIASCKVKFNQQRVCCFTPRK